MQLYNHTQAAKLTTNLLLATSFLKKAQGLIAKNPHQSLYFSTAWGIHTFGITRPLTVLICATSSKPNHFQIKKIIPHLKPNRFLFYNPKHAHLFELPQKQYPAKIGDVIVIKT